MALLRGWLQSFDSGTWTARVRLDGSPSAVAGPMAVSRGLPGGEITPGRRVLVDTGDHGDPADSVVIAVWAA